MRISDWSSDVCSSDLQLEARGHVGREAEHVGGVVPAAIVAVERAAFARVHQAHGEVGFTDAPGQRRRHPFAETHRRRQAGAGQCIRSEEHTSELQSLMRIYYADFCLKKKSKTHRD